MTTISPSNFDANHSERLFRVLESHAKGHERAMRAPVLAEHLGMPYRTLSGNGAGAQVRRAINAAIERGFPICSSNDGYYVPASPQDVELALSELRQKARALNERAAAVEVAATRYLLRDAVGF